MRWISIVVATMSFMAPASAESLRVMTIGLGSGTVNSSPAGINCADCDGAFANGITVTLTATPAPDSTFVRWNDPACPGLGPCVLTMSTDRSIRPEFRLTTLATLTTITVAELNDPDLLAAYLTAHPEVNTPALFLAVLPEELGFRQNWLMMSRSESLQTGTAEFPRFLLPSRDARYVFSFATFGPRQHTSYPGSHPDAIEYMQWDANEKNFRFHEIVLGTIEFPDSLFPRRTRGVLPDDARCSKCHSTRNVLNRSSFSGTTGVAPNIGSVKAKNKPNWDAYDSWGGLLPFNRDRIYQGSVEAAAFRKIFNPWTWRANPAVRSFIEQLQLQPPLQPGIDDVIERMQGGINDGHIKFKFDGDDVVTSETAPVGIGTPVSISYSFDNKVGTSSTRVQRDGDYTTLHHSDPIAQRAQEGRGVQLFDLLGGQNGSLNPQRIGDELASHRYATGGFYFDARPLALAITKDCYTRNPETDDVSPMPTDVLAFFKASNGNLTINGIYDDTLARARSMPRRKADIQNLNLDRKTFNEVDRTGDIYLDQGSPDIPPTPAPGLIQQYGAATSFGTSTVIDRLRQEVFRRPIDLPGPDQTNMGGFYVDREDYSSGISDDFNTERLAQYRYFLEPLGVSVDKWSMGVRGRSRTYTFADVFDDPESYNSTIRSTLEASLGPRTPDNPSGDPIPGLSPPYECTDLFRAINDMSLPPADALPTPTYTDIQRIFNKSCIECHGGLNYPPYSEYDFSPRTLDFSEKENMDLEPGEERLDRSHRIAADIYSRIYSRITLHEILDEAAAEECPGGVMPCGGPPLSKVDTETIRRWIEGDRPYTHGDPHIRTIDGTDYDFQSAGEFVFLRGQGIEIQARQTPIETQIPLGPNAHTGLSSCVSINTAAAIKVGRHRISYQPNLSAKPDPSGMQLRVDGKLIEKMGPRGIALSFGGRILPTTVPGGIQIEYPGSTDIVLTPGWWDYHQLWYLNINVRRARAHEGIAGLIAPQNWLPALPDGSFLGPKPASLYQRYQDLYERFADAWRVNDATSLFDYAPGSSTADFTVRPWPSESPQTCPLPKDIKTRPSNKPPLKPLPLEVAKQHCAGLVEADYRANCEQDVMVTGEPAFAATYHATEKIQLNPKPPAARLLAPMDRAINLGTEVSFTWTKTEDVQGDRLIYMHCVWPVNEALTFNNCRDLPQQNVLLESSNLYLLLLLIICLVIVIIAILRARRGRKLLILLAIAILIAIVLALYFGHKTTMSTTVTGLQPGKAYYWKVVVEDGQGGITDSETGLFATKK